MTTSRYVVAPRVATTGMVDNVPVRADTMSEVWEFMLAAIPDDPNAPVLVERAELEALKRDAVKWEACKRIADRWLVAECEEIAKERGA